MSWLPKVFHVAFSEMLVQFLLCDCARVRTVGLHIGKGLLFLRVPDPHCAADKIHSLSQGSLELC